MAHIHCEDIGGNHIFVRIHNRVGDSVIRRRVRHSAVECQLSVTARCLVKVETVLTLIENINRNRTANVFVRVPSRRNLDRSHARIFSGEESKSINRTCFHVIHCERNITCLNCNLLAVVHCSNRKSNGRTVNNVHHILGEVYVFGNNHRQSLSTDNVTVNEKLNFHATVISQRGEDTVLRNRTKARIGNRPSIRFG